LTGRDGNWSRSFDEGRTWQRLSTTSALPFVVAAADRTLYGSTPAVVSRSDDFGESWTPCGSLPIGGANRSEITSVGADETHVYATLLRAGLFRSVDRCATWTQMRIPWPPDSIQLVKYVAGQRVIVFALGGTYFSSDAGMTWSRLMGEGVEYPHIVTPDCKGSLLLATSLGVYRLTENTERSTYLGHSGRFVTALLSPRCGEILAVVKDIDGDVNSVSISRDDGRTWRDASGGLLGHALTALRIGENGKVYAEAGPSAFQWDGRSWKQIGPVATRVANLVTAPWGETFADAGFLGLFRAGPRLTEWRKVLVGDGSQRNAKPGSGRALFIATPPGGVIRTRDRGVTWELVLNQNVYGFTVTKSGAVLASTQNGIFRSTDQGEVWTERSIGLTTFWVHALTSGPDGTVYAGTRTGEVYRSTDVGDRWRTMGATTGGGHNPVHALIVSKMGTLLAGTYSGMFRWDPQERRWSRRALGADQRKQSVAAIVQNAAGVVFAATKGGMFASSDDGMTWLPANDGLGSEEVLSLAVDSTDHVLAGTTAGVFTTESR
jgi:photosystem II stability/assembly factor-like uncharacterized protein